MKGRGRVQEGSKGTPKVAVRWTRPGPAQRAVPHPFVPLLAWAYTNGRQPSDEEIEVWNGFMTKRGWRDAGTQRLNERLAEIGLEPGSVQTMFEFIDLDEGRRPAGPSR